MIPGFGFGVFKDGANRTYGLAGLRERRDQAVQRGNEFIHRPIMGFGVVPLPLSAFQDIELIFDLVAQPDEGISPISDLSGEGIESRIFDSHILGR